MRVGNIIQTKDSYDRISKESIYDKAGSLILTRDYTYDDKRVLWQLQKGALKEIRETYLGKGLDGNLVEIQRLVTSDSASFINLEGKEGVTFDYIVGNYVIPVTIMDDLRIKGFLPDAMGLKLFIGGHNFDVGELGVFLSNPSLRGTEGAEAISSFILDQDTLFSVSGNKSITEMLLNAGSLLNIKDSTLFIDKGRATFDVKDILPEAPDTMSKFTPLMEIRYFFLQ